jgi:hypothetical protein
MGCWQNIYTMADQMEGSLQFQQPGASPAKPAKAKKQANQSAQQKPLYPSPELLEDLCR